MNSLKSLIWKPTPEEQKRKCNTLIRTNARKLDRDIAQLRGAEIKAKASILQASKRAQKSPLQSKQAIQDTRLLARELVRIRRQNARLATSKAQLQSVQMQVNEAFSVRKIEGSIKASTGIMKDVNNLVKLPALTLTMRELSQELVKAGIIEEMVGDIIPDETLEGEDEEAEAEVDKVLGEIIKSDLEKASTLPDTKIEVAPPKLDQEEDEEDEEEILSQMRGRLEALKS